MGYLPNLDTLLGQDKWRDVLFRLLELGLNRTVQELPASQKIFVVLRDAVDCRGLLNHLNGIYRRDSLLMVRGSYEQAFFNVFLKFRQQFMILYQNFADPEAEFQGFW